MVTILFFFVNFKNQKQQVLLCRTLKKERQLNLVVTENKNTSLISKLPSKIKI